MSMKIEINIFKRNILLQINSKILFLQNLGILVINVQKLDKNGDNAIKNGNLLKI